MSRVTNTIKNSLYGMGSQMLNSVLSFICRTVFIKTLGSTYLGVGGLFTNILSLLSLAAKYMNLYAKAYKYIGIAITLIGILLMPFLRYIIADINAVPDIYQIYILYIINAGSSYFMSYKRTLFEADQKNYIVLVIQTIMNIVMNVTQIVVLLMFHNYIIYFLIAIVTSFATNFIVSWWGTKKYG